MNCEALETALPELLYGGLPDDEAQAANAHLARCAACNRLVDELRPIPGSLRKAPAPPDLLQEIKLAARDQLLEQELTARRGPLHVLATVVLAACLTLVGFALGVRWDSDEAPRGLGPDRVVITPGEGGGGDSEAPGDRPPRVVDGEPLQRMLIDAADGYLGREPERARDYFARARELAPRSPLAAAARAGEARALLALERPQEARELVRETRALILAGDLRADAELLQQLYDLEALAEDR